MSQGPKPSGAPLKICNEKIIQNIEGIFVYWNQSRLYSLLLTVTRIGISNRIVRNNRNSY